MARRVGMRLIVIGSVASSSIQMALFEMGTRGPWMYHRRDREIPPSGFWRKHRSGNLLCNPFRLSNKSFAKTDGIIDASRSANPVQTQDFLSVMRHRAL